MKWLILHPGYRGHSRGIREVPLMCCLGGVKLIFVGVWGSWWAARCVPGIGEYFGKQAGCPALLFPYKSLFSGEGFCFFFSLSSSSSSCHSCYSWEMRSVRGGFQHITYLLCCKLVIATTLFCRDPPDLAAPPASLKAEFLNDDILKFENSFDLLTCCLHKSSCLGWHLQIRGCRVIAYYWLIASLDCLLAEESIVVNLQSLNSQAVWLVSKWGVTGQDNSIAAVPPSRVGVILPCRRKRRTRGFFTSAFSRVWGFLCRGFQGLAPDLPWRSWGRLSSTWDPWEERAGWRAAISH